jgi:hypothetical protein
MCDKEKNGCDNDTGKCLGKGKCHKAFEKLQKKADAPAPQEPKSGCCGGSCHGKKNPPPATP